MGLSLCRALACGRLHPGSKAVGHGLWVTSHETGGAQQGRGRSLKLRGYCESKREPATGCSSKGNKRPLSPSVDISPRAEVMTPRPERKPFIASPAEITESGPGSPASLRGPLLPLAIWERSRGCGNCLLLNATVSSEQTPKNTVKKVC